MFFLYLKAKTMKRWEIYHVDGRWVHVTADSENDAIAQAVHFWREATDAIIHTVVLLPPVSEWLKAKAKTV